MISKIKGKFREKPSLFYAMSIAASWAGAGSLMNSATLARTLGVIPAATWCFFNTIACCLFGLIIWKLPTVREIMRTKVSRALLAVFSVFQIWLCMTAIQEVWAPIAGKEAGCMVTYAVTLAFIFALFARGIIVNILTDDGGMYLIYLLVIVLAAASFAISSGSMEGLGLGLEKESLVQGIYKGALLLPGPFTYPYFYKLLDYNEENGDGVSKTDITRAFIFGGLGFGLYLVFAFVLIFTGLSPVLDICKAVLISVLAFSSLSSFIYSEYAVFGRVAGLWLNVFALLFWMEVAPLGVMGVWTLMAESRVYLFVLLIILAFAKKIYDSRKGVIA